ncbi:hypothetical protein Zmor_011704 [Zophobas morio]|uniref:CCHC-type domain-containing protein n=1 Tax=Zophobas morio TaxID=2755281 RepID=A0AA38IRS7_9CUCU|nr:hypothetical protein Zmor_011704 [Zophobas morio]
MMNTEGVEEYNDIHKPRNSLSRTPPDTHKVEFRLREALQNEKNRKAYEEVVDNVQKAKRSERRDMIRESETDREIDIESVRSEHVEDNVFEEITAELDLSDHLERIRVALSEVRESAIKESEGSRGRITFTRAEQSKILNGVHMIQSEILTLISKQQRTLLNVIELKETVNNLNTENKYLRDEKGITEKDSTIEILRMENKYLKSINNNNTTNSTDNTINGTITNNKNITDNTTSNITANKDDNRPRRTRYASMYSYSAKGRNRERWYQYGHKPYPGQKDHQESPKGDAFRKGSWRTTKAIIPLRTGGILIESYSDQQRKKIGDILSRVLQLSGVEKGYDDKELLAEMYNQNACFNETMSESVWYESVKLLAKRECRNKNKENILVQVKPRIYKLIMSLGGKVILDLLSVFVEEHLRVAVCHKCSQFGHVQKYCSERNGKMCLRCSGEHALSECTVEFKNCPNCKRYSGLDNIRHGANDQECPFYQKRLQIEKRKVRYSGDN